MTTAPLRDTTPLAHADVVVLDYLAALWAESEDLTPGLRDELMNTVADYIAVRRTSIADPLSDPRQVVGRLGPPEALVESVRRGRMPVHLRLPVAPPPRRPARAPGSATVGEHTAIALLTGGAFILPVISPLAAMVLVSASPRWTVAQKSAAWVLVTGSAVCALLLAGIVLAATHDGGGALGVGYLMLLAGSFIAGLALLPGLFARRS